MPKRYVKYGTYESLISEFVEGDMKMAKVTVDDEDLAEHTDEISPSSLAKGLRAYINRNDVDGVEVTKKGSTVVLESID